MSVILFEKTGHIGKIILNRPEARNAFNRELIGKLEEALDQANADEDVHVIVISAAGDRAFSAGFDLKESISDPIIEVGKRRSNTEKELSSWQKVWNAKKPVIAEVQGYCIGGGLHLAFMCDMIIASEDAKFGEPELGFSYVPDILIEPWKLPMNKARELLYLGEFMTAQELHSYGVVNKVVPLASLEEETMKVAEKIASMPKDAVTILKYQLNKTYEIQGLKNAMDFAAELFNLCRINQAHTEGEFNEIVREQGLKAAISWKEDQKNK